MDLRKVLLKGNTKNSQSKIIEYLGDTDDHFNQLIQLFIAGPYRLTQRAAIALYLFTRAKPEKIKPHVPKLIRCLSQPESPVALKRNILRLLALVEIPKKNRGKMADLCFRFLQDKKEPVAVKVYSMTILSDLLKGEPELIRELQLILEDQMPNSTPAFHSRATKVLKKLKVAPLRN